MLGVLNDHLFIRGDIHAVDFVARDIALLPLNLRAQLVEHPAGSLRDGFQFLCRQFSGPWNLAFNDEFWHDSPHFVAIAGTHRSLRRACVPEALRKATLLRVSSLRHLIHAREAAALTGSAVSGYQPAAACSSTASSVASTSGAPNFARSSSRRAGSILILLRSPL